MILKAYHELLHLSFAFRCHMAFSYRMALPENYIRIKMTS